MLEEVCLKFGYDQDGEKDDQSHRGIGEWNHSVEQDRILKAAPAFVKNTLKKESYPCLHYEWSGHSFLQFLRNVTPAAAKSQR